jgi:hypothetical protein
MCKLRVLLIFIGLTMLVFFSSCPPKEFPMDGGLKFENNSNETVIYAFYVSETFENTENNYWGGQYTSKNVILPNSYLIREFSIERERASFKNLPQKRYYLFNLDSVKTIPWERIRDERIILKEVIFNSWEEMEACNFTITYP